MISPANSDANGTKHYCTYFDSAYADRALALIESLQRHSHGFRLWALCMDSRALEILERLAIPGVTAVSMSEIESWDPEFARTRKSRSLIEYYFTVTPVLPLYVLARDKSVELITYLDSDLYFFSSPEPIFAEMHRSSVGIIAHRFVDELKSHEQYGIYNVGFIPFRRDAAGESCLSWWRARCIEWCHDFVDGDRFADQKYLDRWLALFANVHEIKHKGANVAPWNLARYDLSLSDGLPMIDHQPLIFFHFHGLKRYAPGVFDPQLLRYLATPQWSTRHWIYEPYLQALERAGQTLKSAGVVPGQRTIREPFSGLRGLRQKISRLRMFARGIQNRSLIYYFNSRVL